MASKHFGISSHAYTHFSFELYLQPSVAMIAWLSSQLGKESLCAISWWYCSKRSLCLSLFQLWYSCPLYSSTHTTMQPHQELQEMKCSPYMVARIPPCSLTKNINKCRLVYHTQVGIRSPYSLELLLDCYFHILLVYHCILYYGMLIIPHAHGRSPPA